MSDQQHPNDKHDDNVPGPQGPDAGTSIEERNIERMLRTAYDPEEPGEDFATDLAEQMLAAGRRRPGGGGKGGRPWRAACLRWAVRLGAVAAAAAVGFVIGTVVMTVQPAAPTPPAMVEFTNGRAENDSSVQRFFQPPHDLNSAATAPTTAATDRIVPSPLTVFLPVEATVKIDTHLRPASQPASAPATTMPAGPPAAMAGVLLATGPQERRRVPLADGSVLYVNGGSALTVTGPRTISLQRGELYVEVFPAADSPAGKAGPFVVQTPDRKFTALGTRFDVQVAAGGSGAFVTQGQVAASDLADTLQAGQQLPPAGGPAVVMPRATYLLDWTRDLLADAQAPLVPPSPHAGGALVAKADDGRQANLSLRRYHVDVHIEDGFARTTIDQTYFNHLDGRLEGTFYFPLPADASLNRLAMYVNGKLMEGGMVERRRAREVYDSIVAKMKDPALLEWVDGTTFKMQVFPLEGRQEKRIVLSYTQRLPNLYGRATYRFPGGHSMARVGAWSFHGRVVGGAEAKWESPSHDLTAAAAGGDLLLDAKAANIPPNADVVLHVDSSLDAGKLPAPQGRARFSSAEYGEDRYLMLRYRPDLPGAPRRQQRHWVFLVESSADRDAVLARTQAEIVRGMLVNASHQDTFSVVAAGTRTTVLAADPMPVDRASIAKAMDFLAGVRLIGALDLGHALGVAGESCRAAPNPHLVHLGSALPALGQRDSRELLARLPGGAKYVGVGVGKRWGRDFMRAAARKTGGCFTQINPDENVAWRAFDLLATLDTPRLMDLRVSDPQSGKDFALLDDSIAQGEQLCAILRTDKDRGLPPTVTVRGRLDGADWSAGVPVADVAAGAAYLPRTWARLEIDRLLAEDPARHRKQIVELSTSMYVMSPFTSLLVLENDAMYAQHNVDGGRKDHWAMYPCPETIPVVREPAEQAGRVDVAPVPPSDGKEDESVDLDRSWKEPILKSILVRVPAPFFQPRERARSGRDLLRQPSQAVTAWDLYDGTYAGQASGAPTVLGWGDCWVDTDFLGEATGDGPAGGVDRDGSMLWLKGTTPITTLPPGEGHRFGGYWSTQLLRAGSGTLKSRIWVSPAQRQAQEWIDRHLDRSEEALAAADSMADFNDAERSALAAKDNLEADKKLFGTAEHRTQSARIDKQLELIVNRRENFTRFQDVAENWTVQRIKGSRQIDEKQKLSRRLAELTEQAKSLRGQQKFDQAVEVVDRILLIDPSNPWAGKEREILVQFDLLAKDNKAFREGLTEESKRSPETRRADQPWYEYLRYPRNWKQLTDSRNESRPSVDPQDDPIATIADGGIVQLPNWAGLGGDRKAFDEQRMEESKALSETRRTEVPWYQYLRYPKNWKQLTESRNEFQASAAGQSAADEALRDRLKKEIERLSFAEIDFKDVVQFLREYSDVAMHVDWRALHAAGVEPSSKVSVDVRGVTVKRGLDIVLRDVSLAAAGGDAELRYVIDGGVLTISTAADLAAEPIRRVYDVRDLISPTMASYGPRVEGPDAPRPASNTGIFEEESQRRAARQKEAAKEKLTEGFVALVKNTIDPDSWGDPLSRKEGLGFIQILNGQLVVTQTAVNLRALAELIEKLREARDQMGSHLSVEEMLAAMRQAAPPAAELGALRGGFALGPPGEGTYWCPRFSGHHAYFTDLTLYAPAVNTSAADISAVLEAEGPKSTKPATGRIDPAARRLIDAARTAPWQAVTLPAESWPDDRGGEPRAPASGPASGPLSAPAGAAGPADAPEARTILVNGAGQFAWRRTLPSGLIERAVGDGRTILHLYEEIGLATRRDDSRFHRQELRALVPWLVPPAEDLAAGADVTATRERTVMVVPSAYAVRAAGGGALQLTFAPDGRLAERRVLAAAGGATITCETFRADGTWQLLDAAGGVLRERKYLIAPAKAPDLAPDIARLLVLPMPIRTVDYVMGRGELFWFRSATWPVDDAIASLAPILLRGKQYDRTQALFLISDRFLAADKPRIGAYVLLAALGWPEGMSPPPADPGNALGDYLLKAAKGTAPEEFDDLAARYFPDKADRAKFLPRLMAFRSLWARLGRWSPSPAESRERSEKIYVEESREPGAPAAAHPATRPAVPPGPDEARRLAREYLALTGPSVFSWALLAEAASRTIDTPYRTGHWQVARAFDRFARMPGLQAFARYESARALHSSGTDPAAAAEQFRRLYELAARRGMPMWFDQGMRAAMVGRGWDELILAQAGKIIQAGQREQAVELAWQCLRAGDVDGGAEILSLALRDAPQPERGPLRLAAAKYYGHAERWAQAERELDEARADPLLADFPQLWRAAGRIAAQRGRTAKALWCDDRALELECRRWERTRAGNDLADRQGAGPSLAVLRSRHREILDRYAALARTVAGAEGDPPADLVAGVLRTADRWRGFDPDPSAACNAAAEALRRLGAQLLAWDYLTTPLAAGLGEPKTLTAMAGELAREGADDLADRAYAAAFDMDPTNPQPLLDRAALLQPRGHWPLARELYQQIVQGHWAETYRGVQAEAQRMLRR